MRRGQRTTWRCCNWAVLSYGIVVGGNFGFEIVSKGDVGIAGLRPPGGNWREVLEMAALVDGLGYSCITTGEAWGQDAFTSLAQIAAVTSRIRIGTSIVPIFARSPANMAMTALNMDLMSEGRFFLGIGASGQLVIEDFHGERFRKPLTRQRLYRGYKMYRRHPIL